MHVVALLGAIRFLKGYYFVFAMKRSLLGSIGDHRVYSMRGVELFPINYKPPSASKFSWKGIKERFTQDNTLDESELRYKSLFCQVDLTKDAYMSYSLDLSQHLQKSVRFVTGKVRPTSRRPSAPGSRRDSSADHSSLPNTSPPPVVPSASSIPPVVLRRSAASGASLDSTGSGTGAAVNLTVNTSAQPPPPPPAGELPRGNSGGVGAAGGAGRDANLAREQSGDTYPTEYGTPREGRRDGLDVGDDTFVWTYYIMSELQPCVSEDWLVPVIYGFFDQVTCSFFGKHFSLTLLARRSRHFAGTRYLKRGVNEAGFAANDVEIEQIVDDHWGRFASHVQVRGSVPVFWTQATAIASPKPPIVLGPYDATYTAARRHFSELFRRYGGPVTVLNLVKKKEKVPREKLIGDEFASAVSFLNKTLPAKFRIQYLHLDYSALTKLRRNVLSALKDAAEWSLANSSFFCTQRAPTNTSTLPGAGPSQPLPVSVGSVHVRHASSSTVRATPTQSSTMALDTSATNTPIAFPPTPGGSSIALPGSSKQPLRGPYHLQRPSEVSHDSFTADFPPGTPARNRIFELSTSTATPSAHPDTLLPHAHSSGYIPSLVKCFSVPVVQYRDGPDLPPDRPGSAVLPSKLWYTLPATDEEAAAEASARRGHDLSAEDIHAIARDMRASITISTRCVRARMAAVCCAVCIVFHRVVLMGRAPAASTTCVRTATCSPARKR